MLLLRRPISKYTRVSSVKLGERLGGSWGKQQEVAGGPACCLAAPARNLRKVSEPEKQSELIVSTEAP